jgi:hypothetical protein
LARIVVITHEFDDFNGLTRSGRTLLSHALKRGHPAKFRRKYFIRYALNELRRRGHSIAVMSGTRNPVPGDVGILHTDCSVVPQEYREIAARFPITLNARTHDITKRFISDALLDRGSQWRGPVIVKANLNSGGFAEELHNRKAKDKGREPPHPSVRGFHSYQLFASISQVPDVFWQDEGLVAEKFVAESEPDGYAMRTWLFLGDWERCRLNVSSHQIIKGGALIRQESSPVPEELREKRRSLGFDYGKFDFVIHNGRAILIDANRTPISPNEMWKRHEEGSAQYADGFESLLG